jgi:hypothetical protein
MRRVIGILLLVLFALAILGGIVNGSLANLGNTNPITAITEVVILVAMLIGGIKLTFTKKK